MPWVKLDDDFTDHPKISAVGPLAAWLYVCGLTYSARFLTDGFIPVAKVKRLADVDNANELAERLVSAELWERCEGGFHIHDYNDYQPSRAQVESERSAARERMDRARSSKDAARFARSSPEVRSNATRSSDNPVPVPVPERENDSLSCEIGGAGATIAADFDTRFWQRYPKGRGVKKQALAQWRRLSPDDRDAAALGLDKWLACEQWQDPRYVVHAERWLRDRRWEDEPPPTGRGNGYRSQADINSGGIGRLVL